MTRRPSRPWTVIVPVKSTARAKSRLRLDPADRRCLAVAMARDTVAAVSGAAVVGRTVLVVEEAADGVSLATGPGIEVFLTRTAELNDAIRDGLTAPGLGPDDPVAVLPADLPSLTPDELAQALGRAAGHRSCVVPDRAGTGTTLLTAQTPALLHPRYGLGSFRAHVEHGAWPLRLPGRSGLRRDVDRVDDLASVTGRHTLAVLGRLGVDRPGLAG